MSLGRANLRRTGLVSLLAIPVHIIVILLFLLMVPASASQTAWRQLIMIAHAVSLAVMLAMALVISLLPIEKSRMTRQVIHYFMLSIYDDCRAGVCGHRPDGRFKRDRLLPGLPADRRDFPEHGRFSPCFISALAMRLSLSFTARYRSTRACCCQAGSTHWSRPQLALPSRWSCGVIMLSTPVKANRSASNRKFSNSGISNWKKWHFLIR